MIKGLFNRFLKNLKQTQYVMLNWFQHLLKSRTYETLKQVQGDRSGLSTKPSMLKNSSKAFTLIEVVIVIVILSIVSAISIKFVADSLRIYTMTVNQKTLLDEGKLALERMCRDIRDAHTITGTTASSITFTRGNATVQDIADETIIFQWNGGANPLEKVKASPAATSTLAANISSFTVTNTAYEIQLQLTLLSPTGETVTLQTKVYPKNLLEDTVPGPTPTYKNFFYCWEEQRS